MDGKVCLFLDRFDGYPGVLMIRSQRFTQEKRRMGPLPTVAPIKIPASPVKTASAKSHSVSRIRRSIASNSPVWASDSEISPVSGLSAARDVLGETFSFSARTTGFSESTGKEKEMGSRMARQDSATLPKDPVWENAIRTPSVSRKSSAQSVKKRRLDLPPFEAFVLSSPLLRKDGETMEEKTGQVTLDKLPPRNDSMKAHRREGSLGVRPPPGLTPSAQKLDCADQAALHRISRIIETDAEASVSQPTSSSVNGSFPIPPQKDFRGKPDQFRLGSPFKLPSALSSPSTYSKYTASPHPSPGKRPAFSPHGATSGVSDSGNESFLEDFEFVGPSSGPSSRGGRSGYAGSADSPYEAQVPMTAASMSSRNGLKSAPAAASAGFPRILVRHAPLTRIHSPGASSANSARDSPSSVYSSPSAKGKERAILSPEFSRNHDRSGSISSISASVGKSAIRGGLSVSFIFLALAELLMSLHRVSSEG